MKHEVIKQYEGGLIAGKLKSMDLNKEKERMYGSAKEYQWESNRPSVKITVKCIQMYNYIYPTYHAPTNRKGRVIHTPPESHSMQSKHRMWPNVYIDTYVLLCINQCI